MQNCFKSNLSKILFIFVFILLPLEINAATIKGRVIDGDTHETIPGAIISLSGTTKSAATDLDGNYFFKNIEPGIYTINAKFIGYVNSIPQQLTISTSDDVISFDIYMKPYVKQINEVVVQANKNKETDISARDDEKIAPNIINIISAHAIESLPDLNVADVMQRVSGVSMTKNGFGSNSNLIIRGMPPRYNSTLVDGVAMPSTSSSGRSVSLDMFGAELVGRIEVIKALTPDMEGDAIGGTVNIRMKQAPDTAFFKVQAGTGYNQYYFNHDFLTFDNKVVMSKDPAQLHGNNYLAQVSDFPRQNLIAKSEQATPDLNLSFSAGRRFFKNKLGVMFAVSAQSTSMANTYNYTDYIPELNTNKSKPDYLENETYSKNQKRYGGFIKLDYQFNSRHRISFYNSFFQLNELRVREYADHQTEDGGINIIPIATQTETDNSGIECATLKGEHNLMENLDVDWTLLYAVGNSTSPDFATVELNTLDNMPPSLHYSRPVVRDWQWDIDQNLSAYLNINYKPTIFDHIFEIKVGGMARNKYRKNYANEYYFQPDSNYITPKYPNPNLLTVPLRNDENPQEQMGNAINNEGNYRAWEDIQAVYGMVTTTFGKLQILTGVRTEFTYMTNFHNQKNVQVPVASSTIGYFDVLPCLHLTYKFTEKQNLRFSAYQAINRQGYTEVIPYSDPRAGASTGNPNLQHAYANCVDLRYEIYPQREEVFTAGVFYKQINNAIEEVITPGSENTSFKNIALCTNYGLELVAMKYFGNFGFSANYTYTHSSIIVPYNFNNTATQKVDTIYKSRPLVGQSPNLFNLSISYRNVRWGLKTSITYTMQGYNLVSPSGLYIKDVYQAAYNNLGITLEKKIGKKLFLIVKVSNLLNSPIYRYVIDDKSFVEKAYNYQSYYIGLKFSI